MTPCACCGVNVAEMYSPAYCRPCKDAGCDPTGPGSVKQSYDTDYGVFTLVEKTVPCRRQSESS